MSRFVPFLLLALACKGSDDPTDGGPDGVGTDQTDTTDTGDTETSGEVVSVDVSAADGGEVTSGDATLDIPPGALPEDTTITVAEVETAGLPDLGSIASVVYDFGPDGLQFLSPATLEIAVPAAAPNGKAHVISWYDEAKSAWTDLPSTARGLVVTAAVEHFTIYAVRVVDAPNVDVCEVEQPCGGDPVGSWSLLGMCFVSDTPPMEDCPSSSLDMVLDASGGWDFQNGGTYTYDITLAAVITMTIPPECIPPIPRFQCDMLDDDGLSCLGDATKGCVCTGETPATNEVGSGTWVMEGNDLVTTDDADGDVGRSAICVEGNVLKAIDADDGTMLTLQR